MMFQTAACPTKHERPLLTIQPAMLCCQRLFAQKVILLKTRTFNKFWKIPQSGFCFNTAVHTTKSEPPLFTIYLLQCAPQCAESDPAQNMNTQQAGYWIWWNQQSALQQSLAETDLGKTSKPHSKVLAEIDLGEINKPRSRVFAKSDLGEKWWATLQLASGELCGADKHCFR